MEIDKNENLWVKVLFRSKLPMSEAFSFELNFVENFWDWISVGKELSAQLFDISFNRFIGELRIADTVIEKPSAFKNEVISNNPAKRLASVSNINPKVPKKASLGNSKAVDAKAIDSQGWDCDAV